MIPFKGDRKSFYYFGDRNDLFKIKNGRSDQVRITCGICSAPQSY